MENKAVCQIVRAIEVHPGKGANVSTSPAQAQHYLAYLPDGQLGYELANPQPHHHLVCRDCHASSEIPHAIVQPLFQQIQQEFDFKVETAHLFLWRECTHCRSAKQEEVSSAN